MAPRLKKSPLISLLALALSLSPLARAAEPVEADRVVAVVGSNVITLQELVARTKIIQRQFQQQGNALPPADTLRRQVLERMVLDNAQYDAAAEAGLQVDDTRVDEAIGRIAASNKQTLAQFKKAVEKDGTPFPIFREEIRREITTSRLRQKEVENRITVSDTEVDNYLAQEKNSISNDQFHLAHILIRVPENATREQIQKLSAKAEHALKRLQAGEAFAKVAASVSDAPDATQGGDLGLRPAERLPGLYIELASQLKPGQVSGITRSPTGLHLIKLIDRKTAVSDAPVRQTHARHILIKVNEIVSETDAKRKLELLRDRIVHGESFAELARLHSQDGSAPKGGDLGWLYAGDTVPEFEQAMDELKPGAISQPIKSPFGYHLISVIERRNQDASDERKRLAAKQAIRDRKIEEGFNEWLQQLRDRTYVEYRLDEQ